MALFSLRNRIIWIYCRHHRKTKCYNFLIWVQTWPLLSIISLHIKLKFAALLRHKFYVTWILKALLLVSVLSTDAHCSRLKTEVDRFLISSKLVCKNCARLISKNEKMKEQCVGNQVLQSDIVSNKENHFLQGFRGEWRLRQPLRWNYS